MLPQQHFVHCPACGVADVVIAGNRLHCSVCGFQLFFNSAATASAIIYNAAGELLLVQRARQPSQGMWDLVGGFVDAGESCEQALAREVREEIGAELLDHSYIGSFPNQYLYDGVEYSTCDIIYTARITGDVGQLQTDEISDYHWFAPADITLDTIAFPSLRTAMAGYLEQRKK